MKTILVPTDFSKNAEHALRYAIDIAKTMQAKIILLHSFHIDYNNAAIPVNLIDENIEEEKDRSNNHLKMLYNKGFSCAEHPIECISSQNLLVDEIQIIIEEKNVDLIVMGTQGANGNLSRQLFGTNTSRVIEKAKCPVIAIPEGITDSDIKTIVYATEYLNSDITCLQSLVDMARPFKANIKVIHVAIHNNEDEKQLMEEFKLSVIKNIFYKNMSFEILVGNNIEQRIEGYLEEEERTDLLVMSAHQRSLMDKLFGKSITRVMALYLKVPLMVFHHKEKNAKRIKNHKNIAVHLEEATKKHNAAAKHYEAGDYDKAYTSSVQAHDHIALAAKAQTEMLKHYTFTS